MELSRELSNMLVNPDVYADPERINALFAQLRRDAPFARAHPDGFDPFWVATRHADVLDIEKRSDVFHNGDRSTFMSPAAVIELTKQVTGGDPNLIRSLVSVDGEEHKALREITFKALTPASLRAVQEDIRATASLFADRMIKLAPTCDFARDVAYWYPLRVVMQLLGVPEKDEPLMLRLTQEMFGGADADLNASGAELPPVESMAMFVRNTLREFDEYFAPVTKAYRENPTGSLHSIMANATIDGEYLTHRQLMGYYIISSGAGHDTTSNTTSGAMWALAERPELLRRLKDNPQDIAGFVEESVRWASAVKTFMRSATEDTEVAGQPVKKGDWILLSYHSASRDESVYPDPDEFDIDRPRGKQIAFGSGPHVCLGQHLARLEMRLLWEALIPRLKSVELAGVPRLYRSTFVIGPKTVPIRFEVE
ncbi:MAG: cytochrome P450 [Pseudomonadales bacterium]|nr:cytochrome P450 [Pseudomonadales bacterium]MCP5182512.1 cytochrome P450 [Pseudomonadales bacterium]